LKEHALSDSVAAISVGIVDGVPLLDLPYEEDSRADTDMNVVMTGTGRFVRSRDGRTGGLHREELDELLDLAATGIASIHEPSVGCCRVHRRLVRDDLRPRDGESP